MSEETEGTQISVTSLKSTPLKFPNPGEFVDREHADAVREAIQQHGVYDEKGKTALGTPALHTVLGTDPLGAKKFYNKLPDKDKFKIGGDRFVRTPALSREINERIEKSFDAVKNEQLIESDRCLGALRDNPDSRTLRLLNESANRSGQRTLKRQKIARDGISACQKTGEPLEPDAQAHHIVRRADDPDLALNLDNIEIVNKAAHAEHHNQERKIEYE
jgi:5-methylcytosine-specific restriction endonuclease McrA